METNEKVFEVRIITDDISPEHLKTIEEEGLTLRDLISQLISERLDLDQEIGYSVEEVIG